VKNFFNRFTSSSPPTRTGKSPTQKNSFLDEILEDELIDEDEAKTSDYFGNSQEPRDPRGVKLYNFEKIQCI
jgi:hypothetical protein